MVSKCWNNQGAKPRQVQPQGLNTSLPPHGTEGMKLSFRKISSALLGFLHIVPQSSKKKITALTLQINTSTKFVDNWSPSTSSSVSPASVPSYTAPAKWNSLVRVTTCHDFSITQDLRGISFFLLRSINKTHANWLDIVK